MNFCLLGQKMGKSDFIPCQMNKMHFIRHQFYLLWDAVDCWPTLQFIFLYNGSLCKVVRPKCTHGLVHGLRLGQLSDFVGLKVTFSLWWRPSWRANVNFNAWVMSLVGVFDCALIFGRNVCAECANRTSRWRTRQTHVWPVSDATEVLPLLAITLYSTFW